MDIKIFDKRILAPSKCGTRYLRKVYTDTRFDINVHGIDTITHIVIRNPYEHFESAIHTEYLNYTNTPSDINHIILGASSKDGIGHWHPNTYQFLYSIFTKNSKIQIVDLSNLSSFLKSEGHSINYLKSDYDWSNLNGWKSKDELILKLKSEFEEQFRIINQKLKTEFDYYTKLLMTNNTKSLI